MLKLSSSSSAALQLSRVTLASHSSSSTPSASPFASSSNNSHSHTASPAPGSRKMSTAEVRPPPSAADEAAAADEYKQTKPQRPNMAFFPLGYKDAAYQWWTSITPQAVERSVLSLIPFLKEAADSNSNPNLEVASQPDPYGTRVWRRSMVQLSGKNRALNELTVERVGEETEETLVMVHGYGAGLGFFYKNFEPISRVPGLKIHALDMLGMGNSTRPPFKIHAKSKEDQVVEAESWFIDALEEWRKARKIEHFTLLGHSLGGYLAVSYALKYPGRLKKLILASPVGIPEDPYAVNASMPDPEAPAAAAEAAAKAAAEVEFAPGDPHSASVVAKHKPAQVALRRPLPGWFQWLWDANISPFSIVRMTGPLGPRFVSGWSSRRFNHLPPPESQALHDYTFSIFKQKGSGEYALAYILAPGAYARRPVINRIHGVGRQPLSQPNPSGTPGLKETGIPVVLMYGENDWMDVAGGLAAQEKLKEARAKALQTATADEKRRENGSAKVLLVPKAGHHLYIDNPDEFNDMIRKEIEQTKKDSKRLGD